MRRWNVGIIGGGPGGLLTAYFLRKAADSFIEITIFEASDRLGGKIETCRFDSADAIYEAGAAELYDYSPVDEDPLRQLVAELGLSIHPMGGSAVILGEKVVANLDDLRDLNGRPATDAMIEFDRCARDTMSPREFFDSDHLETPRQIHSGQWFDSITGNIADANARRYLEVMIHSDLATEPAKTSVAYGLQNYLMNDGTYMRLYCVAGGNEQIPRELARRIQANVLLGHQVTSVGRSKHGKLRVNSTQAGSSRDDEFDFVVVALPNNYLPNLRFEGQRLAEAMARHHAHYDYPAHYLRVTILFREPFWRGVLTESYFMLDQFDGCCLYDESSREPESPHGVLGWLLGGAAALEKSVMSDAELISLALDSLPEFLRHGRELFLEAKVHRWVWAVNGLPGGVPQLPLDKRHQPEPIDHPDLFVVGDYLFDSTLNGVLDSADYVANWLTALTVEHSDSWKT